METDEQESLAGGAAPLTVSQSPSCQSLQMNAGSGWKVFIKTCCFISYHITIWILKALHLCSLNSD